MYKVVKTDEKSGVYIAKVKVGGSVWFLKNKKDQVISHGKYRDMLDYFKYLTVEEKG